MVSLPQCREDISHKAHIRVVLHVYTYRDNLEATGFRWVKLRGSTRKKYCVSDVTATIS